MFNEEKVALLIHSHNSLQDENKTKHINMNSFPSQFLFSYDSYIPSVSFIFRKNQYNNTIHSKLFSLLSDMWSVILKIMHSFQKPCELLCCICFISSTSSVNGYQFTCFWHELSIQLFLIMSHILLLCGNVQ